jgi:hypothetical protein
MARGVDHRLAKDDRGARQRRSLPDGDLRRLGNHDAGRSGDGHAWARTVWKGSAGDEPAGGFVMPRLAVPDLLLRTWVRVPSWDLTPHLPKMMAYLTNVLTNNTPVSICNIK